MSGRDSLRGYLLQTMVSLLKALDDKNWEAISLEPLHESEKVDIKWRYHDQVKVVQVKSSKNPFSKREIESWCSELVESTRASKYELLLVGSIATKLKNQITEYKGVDIPAPIPLNPDGLLKEISFELSVYCEQRMIPSPRPRAWVILASALVFQLEVEALSGQWFTRGEFDDLLKRWIFTLLPKVEGIELALDIDKVREAIRAQTFWPESWIQDLKIQEYGSSEKNGLSLSNTLNETDKIILLGNSGSGKSYAMRSAADELNRDFQKLCFWIPLKAYTNNLDRTLKRLLGWYEIPDDKVIPTLEKHQAILFLDGLNEVNEKEREQCANELQQLLQSYRGKFCISYPTSDHVYFGFDCPTFKTLSLDKSQIEQAVKTFFSAQGKPEKATWFLQSVRGWDIERQQDFDTLAQTPINLQFIFELVQTDDFVGSGLRDLYGQVIQKRLERMKRLDQRGQISVEIKVECLMKLAYQSIIEGHSMQLQRAYIRSIFSRDMEPTETVQAIEELIRSGLLLEVNEFLVEWPHLSFRDYLAGRWLFELIETGRSFDDFPLEKTEGVAAAAHATRLLTTQSRKLENRSTILFSTLLRNSLNLGIIKAIAEEYHTALDYYIATNQEIKCDIETYIQIQWGERFIKTYKLIVDVVRRSDLPGVEEIPSPRGLSVFFESDGNFCAMLFSGQEGIHFEQVENLQIKVRRSRRNKKILSGFCLYAPFLLLLDPEIVAYLQVGLWLRLRAKNTNAELNEWHNDLSTYISPRNEWISWNPSQAVIEPQYELCASPKETLNVLIERYGLPQVRQLQTFTDILTHSRNEVLSWQEIYMPITFQIDPVEVQELPEPISNRLSQIMVIKRPNHFISLVLLIPWSHKLDFGVNIFVPFPIPLLNRYYFLEFETMIEKMGSVMYRMPLTFVHLRG